MVVVHDVVDDKAPVGFDDVSRHIVSEFGSNQSFLFDNASND